MKKSQLLTSSVGQQIFFFFFSKYLLSAKSKMQMHSFCLHVAYHCSAMAAGLNKGIIIIGVKEDSHTYVYI